MHEFVWQDPVYWRAGLRRWRRVHSLFMWQAAEVLIGTPHSGTIHRWETGERVPAPYSRRGLIAVAEDRGYKWPI